jgi:hypothetical protein
VASVETDPSQSCALTTAIRRHTSCMSGRTSGAIAFVFFLATLAVVDWSLRRWGSLAINQKPRPGGRVTVLFLGICASCAPLEV